MVNLFLNSHNSHGTGGSFMSNKSAVIGRSTAYKSQSLRFDGKALLGTLIFIAAFALLAYILGSAEVAVNPLVPSRIL